MATTEKISYKDVYIKKFDALMKQISGKICARIQICKGDNHEKARDYIKKLRLWKKLIGIVQIIIFFH